MEHRPLLFATKYTRKGADPPLERIKNVAALHDLASYGRCSLTCVIPVLSCMGVKVCPIPTAVYSSDTGGFGPVYARELTQEEYKRLLEVTSEEMDDQIYIVQNPEGKL